MKLIKSTVSFEERFAMVFNDLMRTTVRTRNNAIESGNFTKAGERQSQIDVLEELADKLDARGLIIVEEDE